MRITRLIGVAAATAAASAAFTTPALAAPTTAQTVEQINRALTVEAAPQARSFAGVTVPGDGSAPVSLAGTTVTLPAAGAPQRTASTALYSSRESADARLAVQQPSRHNLRALVSIDGPKAPERYAFTFGGDVASLVPQPDGGVEAKNARGTVVGYIEPAWARDATGRDVPTRFEVSGTTLTQVVSHRGGGYTYGVTADPSFIKILKCSGAVAYAIGSGVLFGAKLIKVKQYMKALGGVKQSVKLVLGAASKGEKFTGAATAVVELGKIFLGVPLIKKYCF